MDTSISFPKMLAVNPSAVQDLRRTSCHPDKKNNHLFFQVVISFYVVSCWTLQFLSVVGLNRLGLDNDSGIALCERTALGGDSACDIARGQSECHSDSGSDRHHQVLNGLPEAFFLNIG